MPRKWTKPETVKTIRLLRSHGKSLPEISRELGVPKTTVFRYVQGVKILPEHLSNWASKRGEVD